MNIQDEINKFAADTDKPCLLWLFKNYHVDYQWRFVAQCKHDRFGPLSYETNRIWSPTREGLVLYADHIKKTKFKQKPIPNN